MATSVGATQSIPIESKDDLLCITPLGAGREVGRSCIVVEYKNKTIMLDCGLHAGHEGINSLPLIDLVDPAKVDLLLVTHFHVDHAAAVPYYLEKTPFRGRTFMTRPTKGVFRWMASDYIRITNTSNSDSSGLYSEADLVSAHSKIEEIDVHQQVEVNGIKFTAYNAGHVLGAAMFLIEIAGVKLLYTGDYSREEDRHLVPAENPGVPVDILITESTYGLHNHEPRVERERALLKQVRGVVRRRGNCLLPVTALGRTQELLLILEEHWSRNSSDLEHVPVYFISALGKTGTRLYQKYVMDMSQRIQRQLSRTGRNPFDFRFIKTRTSLNDVPDRGPCVVLATPGMLQSGVSRQLLERWAPRQENGLIITGYSVEGTLAREINNSMDDIQALSGGKIPLRMAISNISFSAHVDGAQNCAFIDEIRAAVVVLVHGEESNMMRLRANLLDKYKGSAYQLEVYAPRRAETVELHFRGEKIARAIGGLANKVPTDGSFTTGILVEKDFNYRLVNTADLLEFTGIAPVAVEQLQQVPYASSFELLRLHLEQMFGELPITTETSNQGVAKTLRVYDSVDVTHASWKTVVDVEWESNLMSDMAADSVVAVIFNIESCPASVKLTQGHGCNHGNDKSASEEGGTPMETLPGPERTNNNSEIAAKLVLFLRQQFAQVDDNSDSITVHLNDQTAIIDIASLEVRTESAVLQARLEPLIAQVCRALRPLSHRTTALPPPEPPTPEELEPEHKNEDIEMASSSGDSGSDSSDEDNDKKVAQAEN
ncbi:endoribonuclease ysh1 [Coemansia sp. RSA 1250]|nr:endoribonuclease ysh1 [Coemansia sp. RSA 1250]